MSNCELERNKYIDKHPKFKKAKYQDEVCDGIYDYMQDKVKDECERCFYYFGNYAMWLMRNK